MIDPMFDPFDQLNKCQATREHSRFTNTNQSSICRSAEKIQSGIERVERIES